MEIDNPGGVKSVLGNKDTLACMSRFHLNMELENGFLFRVHIKGFKFTRPFYTIRHRNKYISTLLLEFIKFAKSWGKELDELNL